MPRRSKNVLYNKKRINSSISQANRSIQLNKNACDQTQTNVISHIESIGNLILNDLKGSERDRLKQQLLNSCVSNTTTISNLPFSSLRRSLKQVLADVHTFDCHTQRQYRTIGIGDNDVNAEVNKLDITTQQTKNTNMGNDDSEIPTMPKRKTRRTSFVNSSQPIENETKKISNTITRTICTRSSKLNTLNNNHEQMNHVLLNRARKRRSSLINNINTQTQINNVDNTTEKSQMNLQKSMEEDISGVKVSRKKLQSSVPCSTTVECLKTTNNF